MTDNRDHEPIIDADGKRVVLGRWQRCWNCNTVSRRPSKWHDEGDFAMHEHVCKECGVSWTHIID
jgi:hypothetical protein